MTLKLPKELRDAYKAAMSQGWTVTRTGSGHLRWKPPQGDFYITASSPSDPRAIANALNGLRSHGLELD